MLIRECDRKNDLDGAVAAFQRAIKVGPRYSRSYNRLALLYYVQKKYDKAWAVVDAARDAGLNDAIGAYVLRALQKKSPRDKKNSSAAVKGSS